VARIDAVVVQRQRGIATTREAREIQGAVDSFLQATYLDPREDRAILVDWALEAVCEACAHQPLLDARDLELFGAWLDARLHGEDAMTHVQVRLDDLTERLARGERMAPFELREWCQSPEPMSVLIARQLIDLAHQQRDTDLLADMLRPGGLARRFPREVGFVFDVLDRLAHLAHDPAEAGAPARGALIEFTAEFDLAAHVAVRIPAHLLSTEQVRALSEAVEDWKAFVRPTDPWPAPEDLQLSRLALHAALMRALDSRRLAR
jgi:hypothetical protein